MIGEWVAIINWLFCCISSFILNKNASCLCGDNAASGSSSIYIQSPKNLCENREKNDSPCDCS